MLGNQHRWLRVVLLALIITSRAGAEEGRTGSKETRDVPSTAAGTLGHGDVTPGFDPRVDAWCVGEVTLVDKSQRRFAVRAMNLPLSSETARMLREIHEDTLTIADRQERILKEEEIRQSWKARIEAASHQSPGRPVEIWIHEPTSCDISVVAESSVAGLDYLQHDLGLALAPDKEQGDRSGREVLAAPVVASPSAEGPPASAQRGLSSLRIGDCVMVGYDWGLLRNEGYAVIRIHPGARSSSKTPSSFESEVLERFGDWK